MTIPSARGRSVLLALAVAAGTFNACATAAPPPSPNIPTAFAVDIGYENIEQAYQVEAFFPRALTVNVGDSVAFTMKTHEMHTVTFHAPSPVPDPFLSQSDGGQAGNPVVFLPSPPVARAGSFDGTGYVSSGVLGKPGDTFTVTFTAPGTWTAVCLFHSPGMKATIIVNPKGTPRLMADADYRQVAAVRVKDAEAKAKDLLEGLRPPASTANSDGSRSYVVWAGASSEADGIDYMRFVGGEQLTIRAGDSVTFDLSKNVPGARHTITFLAGSAAPPPLVSKPQPGGPPALLVNPLVLAPAPVPPVAFDGKSYTSSGLLVARGPGPQAYTLTFTQPGTFPYQCLLHGAEGMTGTIVVRP